MQCASCRRNVRPTDELSCNRCWMMLANENRLLERRVTELKYENAHLSARRTFPNPLNLLKEGGRMKKFFQEYWFHTLWVLALVLIIVGSFAVRYNVNRLRFPDSPPWTWWF